MWKTLCCGCLLAAAGPLLQAQDTEVRIVTRQGIIESSSSIDLRLWPSRHDALVIHPVVEPAATVSRELADQPVRPWLVELTRAGTSGIFIDPQAEYQRQGEYRIDDNNSILTAQRLARSLTTPSVYVVVGNPRRLQEADRVIVPSMIILKPNLLDKPNDEGVVPVPPNNAPATPKLMAQSN